MNHKKPSKQFASSEKHPGKVGRQLTFPLWPDTDRAIPNSIARSALFGVVKRGARRTMNREPIATWSGVTMIYSGERLDQADLDVWLQVVHMAMIHNLDPSDPIVFSAHSFLKAIGRSTGKSQYQWLERSLTRMHRSHINLEHEDATYYGYLIPEYSIDRSSRQISVTLNPRLANIFGGQSLTRVIIELRLSLKNDLAKWLHAYISSQEAPVNAPHKIRLSNLKPLCGMEGDIKDFRRAIKRDMATLKSMGIISSWNINKDLLEFVRPLSRQTTLGNTTSA
ncbi:MAG: replication initiator protein A [Magnetococcales bacterium]|nr:replication initiator protein A [Magnetococcales bacterium]